ncbi:hypothetical protein BW716_15630 [[Flexibacter] sp. ATCC 35208]|nr:hypothetical protein BW716_15630 [[Flexibacter] sp. ATCC 35208]
MIKRPDIPVGLNPKNIILGLTIKSNEKRPGIPTGPNCINNYTELHYYDGNQVNFGNSSPKRYVNTTFDLAGYLNRPLRIALFVDGQRMAVYLDGKKIQDGIFFNPSAAKNFYITAPWMYENGAKVLVSNIKIYGFGK